MMRRFLLPRHRSPQLGIACFIVVMLSPWAPLLAQAPIVRGYVLGTPASEFNINRVPCESVSVIVHCRITDDVNLRFFRDTLVGVMIRLGTHRDVEARQEWNRVQDSLVALYGEPDSVRISLSETDPTMFKSLDAYWAPLTSAEPWGLQYSVMEVRYQGVTVSQPSLYSSQCFWPEQAPKCPEILKGP